jgi:long-chain acyl-CoA synthetase
MTKGKFWKKAYGREIKDVDPKLFETSGADFYRKAVRRWADKGMDAFVFMGVRISYAQFDVLSNRFANMLIKNGLKPGDVVGINLPNIPAFPIAWLGILKAGCVYTGVSPLLSPDEIEYQLKNCNAKALVTLDALYDARVSKVAPKLPNLKLIVAENVADFLPKIKQVLGKLLKKVPTGKVAPIAGKKIYHFKDIVKKGAFSDTDPKVKRTPDDTSLLLYTGGTTGFPRGAVMPGRNDVAGILVYSRYMDCENLHGYSISAFPMFHTAGLIVSRVAITVGWTQILLPDPRNTDYICDMMAKYKPMLICNVPSMYHLLMANPRFRTIDHSNIQQAISASAAFPAASERELESIIGHNKLIELYGMTETHVTVMNPLWGEHKLGTVGVPINNTEVKLVNTATGKEVKRGEPGELLVRTPGMLKEYLNSPEDNKKLFEKDGFFHTGDILVQDEEGYMTIVDRTKDMINVSGYKVFSKKVEDILAKHPAVEMIATVGVPDAKKPGSELVKAYMTVLPNFEYANDKERIKNEVLALAREKLTPYEVPKDVVISNELPLTSVGKLDKKELRKLG